MAAELQNITGSHYKDAIIDFAGGVAGGVANVYVGQPLDTVKVKMQTFSTMYRNAFQCFLHTLRTEGIPHGLYAGTVPSLTAQVAENAMLFMAYGMCQKVIGQVVGICDVSNLKPVHNALAGSCGAFFASLALCPTELVKCRMQVMKQVDPAASKHIGPMSLTRQILREEGVPGLFRGLVATFAREMPGYFFFFGAYELTRSLLTAPGQTKGDLSMAKTAFSGGMGGLCFWLTIFPSDVIKSRMQVNVELQGTSPLTLGIQILRQEGARTLYRGLGPTLLRTFPATGALFLAYENSKKALTYLATPRDT